MNSLRLASLALLATACISQEARPPAAESAQPDPTPPWAAPPLERVVSVQTQDGERLDLDQLYDRLARADVVFLGETHLDETTHRLELAVYDAMLERRGDVVLAMEMFERDVQDVLDDYLSGAIDEETFLAQARPWSNYRTAYRPLVERARAAGQPVVASNFPRPLRAAVMRDGLKAFDALPPAERRQAPAQVLPNTREYHRRTDNAIRGHIGMMGGPPDPDDPRLTSTQTLWDNTMGESCARALEEHPAAQVVHVNGGFHSAYWDGTVRQLRLRAPDAKIATVAIYPSESAFAAEARGKPVADFVAFTQRGAADSEEGKPSVWVQKKISYRLHLPETARDDARVPLLLWLSDDGLTAADGLAVWRDRLGGECAVAAFEPPYRELGPDQSEGGRWFWVDSFDEDLGTMMAAIEESAGYLLRHFPLDPGRVVVAGEGTGATVAASMGLLTELDLRAVALAPRRYAKIKDYPLPLPEYAGRRAEKSLSVVGGEADEAWWSAELDEYRAIGLESDWERASEDPWSAEAQREGALRDALGLSPRAIPRGTAYVVAPGTSPRARHWARLRALDEARQRGASVAVLENPEQSDLPAGATEIPLGIDRDALARGEGLPRCPGPFGGTTVLVVPERELDAWLALEQSDPLAAQSRFYRVRVAAATGDHALPAVLAALAEEGRTNALIVPAEFCASGDTMRALVGSVEPLSDRMTLHWLPGLGGS